MRLDHLLSKEFFCAPLILCVGVVLLVLESVRGCHQRIFNRVEMAYWLVVTICVVVVDCSVDEK